MSTTPNADKSAVITYTVTQRTTSPNLYRVADRFEKELKLQFGSTVDVKVVSVRDNHVGPAPWIAGKAPSGPEYPHDPNSADGPDYDQADREAIMSAAAAVRPRHDAFNDRPA